MILMNVSMISYIQIAIVKLNSWNSNFDNIPNRLFIKILYKSYKYVSQQ